ncbi:hypothetical protein chiPu_0013575 [Chiloscyllium punctatum]|uniref:Uncharacterized protein n=1 Tax=Chiloscyllium punctatum TaxID=137246 RepID=A0A401SXH8_CHIPU|nr:hypothetical protein [Chiloscyllium punctatum]
MFNLSPDFRRSQSNITLTEFGRPGAAAGGESRKDQYEWRVQQLLGPQHMEFQQYQSDTNTVDSIRTEDFALRFHEGMVDPALNFDAEPDSEQNSFVSRSASCSEHSLEYACLESNTQPGNLARKVCGRPWKQRLFRREASNTECAQLDCTAKQGCCGVVTETSARIHLAQSLTGAEQDESVGNVIPRCDQGSAGVDGPVNSVAQRVNDVQQFQEDLEHALQRTRDQAGTLRRQQANSKALTRRTESVESLGGRISKLSQFNLSELSLQRRTFLSKNRIQVANQCRESNRLTGNGLETSSSPVSDLGVLTQEDRGTNLASTGIKMKGLQKSQAESPERHSGGHNPELQGLSKEGTGNWRPMEQESSTPNDMPLSPKLEDNQQDAVTVNMNRTPSPCHMIPTLGPCCTQSVSSSPAHLSGSFNYSGKTNTSGQWHRITSAPSAFESQFLESEGCQAAAVSLSGSVPLSMGHAWKGDCDSKLVSCHDSDVAHSAFHSRRRVYLSQGKQTDAINVTEVRRTHVRSNTDGAYREELRSHGLGNFRVKPTSRELDANVSGSHIVKKRCHFQKELGRHSSAKNLTVDENDFEQFFREPGSKWRTSSPSKWSSQVSDHKWIWNRAPEISSFYRQAIQSSKETVEKGQQDSVTLESRQQETQNKVPKTSMELAMPAFQRDGCLQELQDLEMELDLKQHSELRQRNAQLTERNLKISALEKLLSEKELEQLRLRETVMVLRTEKEAQLSAIETLREEHVGKQWEQNKHEETLILQERDQGQAKSMKKLREELEQEAMESVPIALDLENKNWEADLKKQLQQHGPSLEEVNGRAIKQANEDLEKERRNSLALQHKLVELQKRIQELEVHSHSLQHKTDQAISDLKTQMTEEKEKEIQQLRKEIQLGKEKEMERNSKMEEELHILWAKNNEASLKEKEARMQEEQAEMSFVSEMKVECERIRVLIQSTQMQALRRVISPACSKLRSLTQMTLGDAIHALCRASEDLRQLVVELHQELESQRFMVHHLQADKDDTKQVSKLQRPPLTESGREKEHTLQERTNELPAVQRTMTKWDNVTACKHTHMFEEKQNVKYVASPAL